MFPNKCPSEDAIARLAAGGLDPAHRDQLVSHILRCERCRLIVQDFNDIKFLLSCSRRDENGKVAIEPPGLGKEAKANLKRTVLDVFQKEVAREKRLLALIEEAAGEFGGVGEEEQPVTIGYYARVPGEEQKELHNNLVRLMSILLDPSLPANKRLSWAEEMVKQLKKKFIDSKSLARRIEEAIDLEDAGQLIAHINEASKAAGKELWTEIDKKALARRIEESTDLEDAGQLIARINEASKVAGKELWEFLSPETREKLRPYFRKDLS